MVEALVERLEEVERFAVYGRVTRVVGLVVEAVGVDVALGELCLVRSLDGRHEVRAEVVGFHRDGVLLMPFSDLDGVHPGSSVQPLGRAFTARAGEGLLGRVLDGLGRPMDGKGPLGATEPVTLAAEPPNPLQRARIREPLSTGIRALDGLLTVGQGQRIGIFSGSGVGKSTLLGMIARRSSADVNVIALLGERGREVREFIEQILGPEGLARSVLVVATGDQSALIRSRGALVATALAEYFRDRGQQVLLMLDSVTRVAMAWREIGLAVGEPPTTKGYPPSVFANLPRLLERTGNGKQGGITGIYTVLVEGDDLTDPVADHVRGVLDGHVVLSRELADRGHFPAIDVLASTSRVRDQLIDDEHREATEFLARLLARYREKEDLISVGAYEEGRDPELDAAIRHRSEIESFLQQSPRESSTFSEAQGVLLDLANSIAIGEGV